jgi:hypothetical protein
MRSPINTKLVLAAAVVVFVVHSIWLALMSRLILWPLFDPNAPMAPTPENIWMMRFWTYLGRAIFCLAFVLIFTRGYEGKPGVGEGIRYGLLIGMLIFLSNFFPNLATQNAPMGYFITRCIFEILGAILLGILTNMIYKPKEIKPGI